MKPDEFERELRQRPLRSIPIEWRAEILSSISNPETKQSRRLAAVPGASGRNPWIELFRAWRGHFAGLASVWLLIIAFNATTPNRPEARIAKATVVPPEMSVVRHAQQQLLAELFETTPMPTAERPKPVPARPRSDLPARSRPASLGDWPFPQSCAV